MVNDRGDELRDQGGVITWAWEGPSVIVLESKKGLRKISKSFSFMAGDARLERATSGSGDQRSIQLS